MGGNLKDGCPLDASIWKIQWRIKFARLLI